MTRKMFYLFLAMIFAMTLPLAAQTPDEPTPEEMEPTPMTEPAQDDVDVDADAYVDEDGTVEAELEANVDDDFDNEIDADADFDDEYDEDGFEDDELPQTATPLALIALLGLGSAATAFGLRARRK